MDETLDAVDTDACAEIAVGMAESAGSVCKMNTMGAASNHACMGQ